MCCERRSSRCRQSRCSLRLRSRRLRDRGDACANMRLRCNALVGCCRGSTAARSCPLGHRGQVKVADGHASCPITRCMDDKADSANRQCRNNSVLPCACMTCCKFCTPSETMPINVILNSASVTATVLPGSHQLLSVHAHASNLWCLSHLRACLVLPYR